MATRVKKAAGQRPVRRGRCKEYVQRTVQDALPETMEAFSKKMKRGDATAFKTLWQAAELDKEPQRRRRRTPLLQHVLKKLDEGKEKRGSGRR